MSEKKTSEKKKPEGFKITKGKRNIMQMVIHCTATPEGRDCTPKDIDSWHKEKGFSGIGYHYVVDLSGKIHEGRPLDTIGAHARGYNAASIGVCYVGGIDKAGQPADTRTDAQKAALSTIVSAAKKTYPSITVVGHRDISAKACPCFDARTEYK